MNSITTLLQLMVVGVVLAFWACLDPMVSNYLGIDFFPYVLSVILASAFIIALLLLSRIKSLWDEREYFAITFAIVMAQFSGISFGRVDLLELSILFLVGFWFIQSFVETERKIQVSPLYFFIFGLVFLSVLSLINRPPLGGFVSIGEKFILFFIIVDMMRRTRTLMKISNVLIWLGLFSAVVAIVQFIVYKTSGYLLTIGAPTEDPTTFLKPTPFGVMPRVTAFFPNPAGLNDYLLFSLSVSLFALTSSRMLKSRLFYMIASLLMATAIILTWSIMGLIGLTIVALLFLYIYRPSLSIQYSCVFLLMIILAQVTGLLEWGYRNMEKFTTAAGSIRIELLELGMESLDRNPVIGLGIQNFQNFSGNYFPEGPYIYKYPVHNAFMQMSTELGIFGGLIFLGIVAFIFMRIITALRSNIMEVRWVFKGFLLGFIAIVFHMMTEPMAYEGTLWLIFGLIEGAGIATHKEKSNEIMAL
jgi:hypothetical protein